MSTKYLGGPFDIHGGGIDNIFPHNECEIAQWEAAADRPFARVWLLTGSLTLDSVKMSKSLGNVLTIKDALRRWSPQAIRFFILSSHYSNPIDFSDAALEAAQKGVDRLWGPVRLVRDRLRAASDSTDGREFLKTLNEHHAAFVGAMDDNFNAPAALGVLSKLTTDVNSLLNSGQPVSKTTLEAIDKTYRELGGGVLGVIPDAVRSEANLDVLDGLVRMLIDMRAEARANKEFARADAIRQRLTDLGVALEDGRDGTTWRLTR
jgi:cysteinyl-tRNA synthetase